ncbi:MAG: hypothetical protein ACYC6Y_20365 [Thermoguttaceae bacterium]
MRGNKSSIERARAVSRYEEIRKTLLANGKDHCLQKPLGHWVLPADRRLPLAFLGRSLDELLHSGFDELAATPGVGRKKIGLFLDLLTRVASAAGNGHGNGHARPPGTDGSTAVAASSQFDPDEVSDVVWNQWQESVRRCGLGGELLGQVAPSLRNVTRVIWRTPLSEYLEVSLAEMRGWRTYGEKRVRAVLEIFFTLHDLVGRLGQHEGLAVRLVPQQVYRVERWMGQSLQHADLPQAAEIGDNYIGPLLAQLRHDASDQIVELAEIRLGIHGSLTSVRQVARQMSLTRARIYQLLNEINDVLSVRWPLGRWQTYRLLERLEAETPGGSPLDQFRVAAELFYPTTRRGAAGALEQAAPAGR